MTFFVMDSPAALVKARPMSLILVKWSKHISGSWRKTEKADRQFFMQQFTVNEPCRIPLSKAVELVV